MCAYNFYEHPLARKHYIGDYIFKKLFALIRNDEFDEHWGGYLLKDDQTLFISWLYYGDPSFAAQNGAPLKQLNAPYNNSDNTNGCAVRVFDTFWGYQQHSPAEGGGNVYNFNSLVPKSNLTDAYAELCM